MPSGSDKLGERVAKLNGSVDLLCKEIPQLRRDVRNLSVALGRAEERLQSLKEDTIAAGKRGGTLSGGATGGIVSALIIGASELIRHAFGR